MYIIFLESLILDNISNNCKISQNSYMDYYYKIIQSSLRTLDPIKCNSFYCSPSPLYYGSNKSKSTPHEDACIHLNLMNYTLVVLVRKLKMKILRRNVQHVPI